MNENQICPIWGTITPKFTGRGDQVLVDSPRTDGKYVIDEPALKKLEDCDDDRVKARLTSWLVEQRRMGTGCPRIELKTIEDAKQSRDLTVHERADRLLLYIERETSYFGEEVCFNRLCTSMLAWSESVRPEEVEHLLKYLNSRKWIEFSTSLSDCILSAEGYTKLEELKGINTESSRAFVAMWFDKSTDSAWEHGIKPGTEDAGYEPIRVDRTEHNNKIDDQIIAEIRRSRFVVADFTQGEDGARGGVYYEAGFAHGLGIPVIFTCPEGMLEKVHFDTRQYNHIVWNTPEELRQSLATRISAVIGDGPHKGDNAQ